MNSRDSSGFSLEDLELIRAERCTLLEFPGRDLRIVRVAGDIAGFVWQWGNSRFWALITIEPTLTSAYSRLDEALTAVEFADLVQKVCGICGGVRQ